MTKRIPKKFLAILLTFALVSGLMLALMLPAKAAVVVDDLEETVGVNEPFEMTPLELFGDDRCYNMEYYSGFSHPTDGTHTLQLYDGNDVDPFLYYNDDYTNESMDYWIANCTYIFFSTSKIIFNAATAGIYTFHAMIYDPYEEKIVVTRTIQITVTSPGPTVTDANISIDGASGTGGAFKIGDTVTATWNNTSSGDNNGDIDSVKVDFSQFGGGNAVTADNSGGIWTAEYTITAGSIDATSRNVSVTATDSSGSTTTADTTNATVDNIAPTVTDGKVAISGASGGAFKIGDTVTATWNNTSSGDNNGDIDSVKVDFSAFGGGSAVPASNSSGTWMATYTITAGSIDSTNLNVSVTATDDAGNTTTTADTANATVDNIAPTVTAANISISGGSGTGGEYKAGDTVTAAWNNTAGGDSNSDTISGVTVDFSQFGGSTVAATNSGGTWTATYAIAAGGIDGTNKNVSVTATDDAGNATTMTGTNNATVDTVPPTAPTVTSTAVTNNATPTWTWTAGAGGNGTYRYSLNNSDLTSGATETTTASFTPDVALSEGSHTLYVQEHDAVAVSSSASDSTNASPIPVTITFSEDVTGFTAGDITVSNGSAGNFATTDAKTYTAEITPATDGAVTVNIAAGVATDAAGNGNTAATQLTRTYDTTPPTAGGVVTVGSYTHAAVSLSWPAGTDTLTLPENLQYAVVYSQSNNISTVTDAENNGVVATSWTANITTTTVSGLSASTTYFFNVLVKDELGNKAVYAPVSQATTAAPSGGGSSNPGSNTENSAEVIVNGEPQTAGTAETITNQQGQTVTTVTVDTDKLNAILESKRTGATVTIPVAGGSDVAAGVLTGQMVKNMETKEATLVVQTGSATYTLPAAEINIDAVSAQFGENISLSDITVAVEIASPSAEMIAAAESAVAAAGCSIVIPALSFTTSCTYNGETVEVSSFSDYVERMIAIPDGVDASKITTGVVVNADGTIRHVPTQITVIDGKYYAVINSLTNSTYTVIWHPVEFSDVETHWAKQAINDMGSRLVIDGVGSKRFEPERNMTRAEFAAIIVRALGLAPGSGESGFSDVNVSAWHCGYIGTASEYGIITGYSDGTFRPNNPITREQAMAMIARAMMLTGLKVSLSEDEISGLLGAYEDGTSAADYAKGGIAACLQAGIAAGKGESAIRPKDFVTRGEVAAMVQRLLQKSELI